MTSDVGGESALAAAVAAGRTLADVFHDAGQTLYLVGGVVRDEFAGRIESDPDLDCTTDARPERIIELVESVGGSWWATGVEFGTIGCRIGSRVFEITTHRADAYEPDSRKPVVAFGEDIEEDLARRDFTVNAMAVDLADERLIDPFDGRGDLARGRLRTPLDPSISFSEDPLRMLRAARFSAGYSLVPTPTLTAAVTEMVDRIAIVSIERIRIELEKLLMLADPTSGFEFMVTTGLWTRVLPVLATESAPRRAAVVAASRSHPVDRWAALVALDGVEQLDSLRLSNESRAVAAWLVETARTMVEEPPTGDRALRELGLEVPAGEVLERVVDLIAALQGEDQGGRATVDDLRARVSDLRGREPDFDHLVLPLNGDQVMELLGLEPGPAVGRALAVLRRHRVEHGPLAPEQAVRILTGS